jgi:hypothetical protein
MSITFNNISDAKEYQDQKEQEGYKVQINKYKENYIVYLISKTNDKEYVYPNKSVHLTKENLGEIVELRTSDDYVPAGVSFSPTIKQALEGIPSYYTKETKDWKRRRKFVKEENEFNVYTPVRKQKAIIPQSIDDFKRTGERRVLNNIKTKRIGKIKVKVGNNE